MNEPRRYLAFIAYLLSIVGWLYVLLFRREDEFATYHAKQSMVLTLVAVAALVAWAVFAWIVSWIPIAGPFIAAVTFTLVIAVYMLLGVTWIIGMIRALQAQARPLPIVGGWSRRFLTTFS